MNPAPDERKKELRYFRTGVAEVTDADRRMVEECIGDWSRRLREDPALLRRFAAVALGVDLPSRPLRH